MKEVGEVIKVEKNFATVKVDKKDECAKCGMCLFANNAKFTKFNANNSKIKADVGDQVMIETGESGKVLGMLLVFAVPLLLIGLACILGLVVIKNELAVLWFSLGFIVVWFFILAFIDKKLRKLNGFQPVVVMIVKKKEQVQSDSLKF